MRPIEKAAAAERTYFMEARKVDTLLKDLCESVNSVTQGNPDRFGNQMKYLEEILMALDSSSLDTIKKMEDEMLACIVSSTSSSEDAVCDGFDSNLWESVMTEAVV